MEISLDEKIKDAQQVLMLGAEMSERYYHKPLIIAYSGGKDSDVLLDIAKKCLKPTQIEVVNSHTTVDAPETVYHIRDVLKKCEEEGIRTEIRYPTDKDGHRITMWTLIEKRLMPPTRLVRYCCSFLKENTTPNRLVAVGVREDESSKRQGRDAFQTIPSKKEDIAFASREHIQEQFEASKQVTKEFNLSDSEENVYDCKFIADAKNNKSLVCNPIYKFTEEDIWEYAKTYNVDMNCLYSRGYKRIGCIGCPLSTVKNRRKEFADYPKYKDNFIRAFDRMLIARQKKGYTSNWANGEEVFRWYIGPDPKQMTIEDLQEDV